MRIKLKELKTKHKSFYIATFILLLLIAFFQCYKTAHDLTWTVEEDFDRDQSFVQGTLDGNFGKDPSYRGEFLWYNPLLFLVETAIVKITHLPVNIVLARAGIYLNLLAPLVFAFMCYFLFNFRTALAAATSFIFFSTGNLWGWSAATYSPWLYPVCFMQFIFYLNIVLCYKAFSTQKYFWFLVLGVSLGISFLGHTAPTMLIILIMLFIQLQNIFKAFRQKENLLIKKYFLHGILTFVLFIVTCFPFLFFIIGKYKLHMINRMAFELTQGHFNWFNFHDLFAANLSLSAIVAFIGLIIFYKNFSDILIRKIISGWFYISISLFFYSTAVGVIHAKYNICLPGFVPSFHFFFYLKALQSLFFGYGFAWMFKKTLELILPFFNKNYFSPFSNKFVFISYPLLLLLIVILYLPVYSKRADFVKNRVIAIAKANDKDKVGLYEWIVKNLPPEVVILCPQNLTLFPVLATGRKMV